MTFRSHPAWLNCRPRGRCLSSRTCLVLGAVPERLTGRAPSAVVSPAPSPWPVCRLWCPAGKGARKQVSLEREHDKRSPTYTSSRCDTDHFTLCDFRTSLSAQDTRVWEIIPFCTSGRSTEFLVRLADASQGFLCCGCVDVASSTCSNSHLKKKRGGNSLVA